MDTCIIGIRSNGERFINYNYLNNNIPTDTEIITLKELPKDIIDRIKEATFEEVEKILCNYI